MFTEKRCVSYPWWNIQDFKNILMIIEILSWVSIVLARYWSHNLFITSHAESKPGFYFNISCEGSHNESEQSPVLVSDINFSHHNDSKTLNMSHLLIPNAHVKHGEMWYDGEDITSHFPPFTFCCCNILQSVSCQSPNTQHVTLHCLSSHTCFITRVIYSWDSS